MPYVSGLDGTDLFYCTWGSGYPVVFIHGGNVASEIWNFQVPYLVQKGYQCIAYDQRGFARSDCPRTGYDFDTLASDLDRLVTHLRLSRFSVVTYSLGGGVLARYLTRHGSHHVESAVLVSSITPCFIRTHDNPEGEDRATMYESFRTGMINDRPQIIHDSLDAFFKSETAAHPVSPSLRSWVFDLALRSQLMPMLEFARASSETDFRSDMPSFTMPTLIVHGDADVFVPARSTGERTHRMIRGSRFVSYSGASHGLPLTHHGRLNEDIAQFISRPAHEAR